MGEVRRSAAAPMLATGTKRVLARQVRKATHGETMPSLPDEVVLFEISFKER